MTTATVTRFPAHEAAQGARRAKLAEIDLFFTHVREDITAERDNAWSRAIAESLERIRAITAGVDVDKAGRLIGPALRAHIATRKLVTEALDMRATRVRIEMQAFYDFADAKDAQMTEREPYDFGFEATPVVVEDRQCGTCGWLTSEHWIPDGACPEPRRRPCGSCDYGMPMNCTCTDAPTVPSKEN